MEQLITYLIQSTVSIMLFYACYTMLLKKESYFGFNRLYLLAALAVSSTLPFLSYNLQPFVSTTNIEAGSLLLDYQHGAYQLEEVVIGNATAEGRNINPLFLLLVVYLAGVAFKSSQFLFRLAQLFRYGNRFPHHRAGNLRFIVTEEGAPTFSFLNYIFIAPETYRNKEEFHAVIRHEQVHADQYHSLDLITSELILIVQWFNPFAYLLVKQIKENHEFLADEQVLLSSSDLHSYQLLLVEHASGIKTNKFTHNFSYSLLKRRLFMMKKQKNPIRFSIGMIGVLITSLIVLFACSRPDEGTSNLGNELPSTLENQVTYTEVETMPVFPGGMDSLGAYLSSNINYPEEARENGITGKVMVGFVIDKNGSVVDVEVKKGIGSGCDKEAARVISNMPDWIPGQKDGKSVRVSYVIPINFDLGQSSTPDEVFTVVEQMPEFPGGIQELMIYLQENIKYPEVAKKENIKGRVFIQFVVGKDGSIETAKVLRGIGGGCDEEALRVVKNMPNWNPGMQKGKAVRVQYNIPIKFALD